MFQKWRHFSWKEPFSIKLLSFSDENASILKDGSSFTPKMETIFIDRYLYNTFFVASYLCYLENEKSFLKMLFEFIFKKWPVEISRFFNESLGILRFIVKLFNFCDFVCLVALQATKAIPTFDKKKKNKGGR